jgi:hypothetical protein
LIVNGTNQRLQWRGVQVRESRSNYKKRLPEKTMNPQWERTKDLKSVPETLASLQSFASFIAAVLDYRPAQWHSRTITPCIIVC